MTPQRQRIASLKRTIRDAVHDGAAPAFIARLRAMLAAEEQTLQGQREPGQNQANRDLELLPEQEDDHVPE